MLQKGKTADRGGSQCLNHQGKTYLVIGCPSMGWDSLIPKEELERVQRRCLRIIGLPREHLPTLEERRDEATVSKFKNIISDSDHALHDIALEFRSCSYNLRPIKTIQSDFALLRH